MHVVSATCTYYTLDLDRTLVGKDHFTTWIFKNNNNK